MHHLLPLISLCGVLQSSVLGPLLFSVHTLPLKDIFIKYNNNTLKYTAHTMTCSGLGVIKMLFKRCFMEFN